MIAAIIVAGLLHVIASVVPAGFVMCIEQSGRIAFEPVDTACCPSLDGIGRGLPDASAPVSACQDCIDLTIPRNPSRAPLLTSCLAGIPAIGMPPPVAIIDWPHAHRYRPQPVFARPLPPPHLIQTEIIVIRC